MRFLFISVILHLALMFKFFNYENIHSEPNKEKVVSISITDFSKKLESQVKKVKTNKPKENKSFEKKAPLQKQILNEKISPIKNTDAIIKNEDKQLETTDKSIIMEKKDYPVANLNKEIITEEVVSTFSNSTDSSGIGSNSNVVENSTIYHENSKGVSDEGNLSNREEYIAKNQDVEGLNYNIVSSVDPEYPIIAKKANYKTSVIIKVRFLVNGEGKIEDIKFYDNETKFGFHEEVENSLKQWKFSPPKLNGNYVKMYFYKSFVFKLN